MTISERIFKILEEKHMSQSEFARKVGLPNSTVSDWKRKKTNPSIDKAMSICEVLGITPEQLLTGKDIDDDYYTSSKNDRTKENHRIIVTSTDIDILNDFHSMKAAQRKRLLKYISALKQIEELEDL